MGMHGKCFTLHAALQLCMQLSRHRSNFRMCSCAQLRPGFMRRTSGDRRSSGGLQRTSGLQRAQTAPSELPEVHCQILCLLQSTKLSPSSRNRLVDQNISTFPLSSVSLPVSLYQCGGPDRSANHAPNHAPNLRHVTCNCIWAAGGMSNSRTATIPPTCLLSVSHAGTKPQAEAGGVAGRRGTRGRGRAALARQPQPPFPRAVAAQVATFVTGALRCTMATMERAGPAACQCCAARLCQSHLD